MDKAPDFGSGDCRFESCHARSFCLQRTNPYDYVKLLLCSINILKIKVIVNYKYIICQQKLNSI